MKKYRVADAAAPFVQYDMIQQHTELPVYAEPRLQLLFGALKSSNYSKEQSELYNVVTALVQLGMDTHDLIDTETGQRTEEQMRSRQLKILAGDYFSARFYQLLAKAGEIELIGLLSKAVADVNRLKVSLYEKVQSATLSAEEYLSSRINLKSEMFKPFQRFFEEPLLSAWNELLHYVSRFEVFYEELKDSLAAGGYARSFAYWSLLGMTTTAEEKTLIKQNNYEHLLEKYNIHHVMLDKLHTAHEAIHRLLEHEHFTELKHELHSLMEEMALKVAKYSMKRVEAQ
ncbi:heptaprenyl diphosphate synthase component 1 [Paenibacillus septentrionalis]|uniref:Heptaprenyl diphosphate synthase component 1 n=1 Tax=Paenibacillus septentrionalis TaxID=429342 RepID=A0ABW1V0M5_9BACL